MILTGGNSDSVKYRFAGFSRRRRVVTTLFQKPEGVLRLEEPREGYFPRAGFTVVVADKRGVTGG